MKKLKLLPKNLLFIFFISLFFNCSNKVNCQSNDWLQWRGAKANGYSPETNWNPKAILNENCIVWKINIGMGHSAVAVKGNRIYTMGNFEN